MGRKLFHIMDKNIADAIETVANEFAALEGMNEQLNLENRKLNDENEELTSKVAELEEKIKKLEEALIEAHLTGKYDGEESKSS